MSEEKEELEKISGTVDNIIFASDDGKFCVMKIRPEQGGSAVSVTVNTTAPLVGENVELEGTWTTHARFGQQFKAVTLQRKAPATSAGIERFLASGAIKGIGPAMAKRIVDRFGTEALTIIGEQPSKLLEIEGIGKKKVEQIHSSYADQYELREIMLFLEMNGVSGSYAGKLYQQYSSFAIDAIKDNPYRLAKEVDGIGFRTADQIAEAMGIEKLSAKRIEAGIDFALLQIAGNGHCCVPEKILIDQTAKLIQVDRMETAAVLKALLAEDKLFTEEADGERFIYPRQLYRAEKGTAEKLLLIKEQARQLAVSDEAAEVAEWEDYSGISLAEQQREAIIGALKYGVLVLTGGPGTGKTTVVRGIIDVLEGQGCQILLGAPTGRAAKRLAEATGRKARTVHRMLESQGGSYPVFLRNADDPLEADVIILDEVSMMDITLMYHFLDAVPRGCRVIFVGDADQLPAVGPGAVLKDMLRSGVVPQVRLTEVFRQAGESMIVMNAHAINQGRTPDVKSSPEFQFREMDSYHTALAAVALCVSELKDDGFDVLNEVQVLSPMHRCECGVSNLNEMLQNALNPAKASKPSMKVGMQELRLGDKVMQTRNNYTKNVFNGDIGFVVNIEADKLIVSYPELDAEYEKAEVRELQLAYAMSVHKSQGSEYAVVILPLTTEHYAMLQRNLLYTAVTRAKKRVILLGSRAALNTALSNDRTRKRYTMLAERLHRAGAVH